MPFATTKKRKGTEKKILLQSMRSSKTSQHFNEIQDRRDLLKFSKKTKLWCHIASWEPIFAVEEKFMKRSWGNYFKCTKGPHKKHITTIKIPMIFFTSMWTTKNQLSSAQGGLLIFASTVFGGHAAKPRLATILHLKSTAQRCGRYEDAGRLRIRAEVKYCVCEV